MRVSVVITFCPMDKEEAELLSACIKSVLKTDYECEVIVETAINQSYAVTLNKGLKKATGDYIFVSNNDIIVPYYYAERMIEGFVPGVYALCAAEDKSSFVESEGEISFDIKKLFGSFWVMPRSTLEKIGFYDERFEPFLFEDSDYWWRILEAGGKIGIVDRVHVWHKKASSTTKKAGLDYQKIYDTNRQRFIDKWGKDAKEIFH